MNDTTLHAFEQFQQNIHESMIDDKMNHTVPKKVRRMGQPP